MPKHLTRKPGNKNVRCHQHRDVSYDPTDDPFEESEDEEYLNTPLDRPPSLKMDDFFQDLPLKTAKSKATKSTPAKVADSSKAPNKRVQKGKKKTPIHSIRPHSDLARSVYEELMSAHRSEKNSIIELASQLRGLDLSLSSENSQNEPKKIKLELRRTKSCDIHSHCKTQCSCHPWDQLKRTHQGMLEFESSKLSCDPNFYQVNIGPSPRGSMIVKCPSHRTAIAVIWSVNLASLCNSEKSYSVRIIPLVGCDWNHCSLIQKEISSLMSSQMGGFPEAEVTEGTKGDVQIFSLLSRKILQLHDFVLGLLETTIDAGETKMPVFKGIYNGLKRASLPLGHSLDHYVLLDHLMKADLAATEHANNVIWDGEIPPVLLRAFEIPPHADSAYGNTSCLVCFDQLAAGSCFECLDCGHSVCEECFSGYLDSSASDGASSIKCPAVKCPTRLSILDIAHILFLAGNLEAADVETTARKIFPKLFRFAVERYLPVAPSFFPEHEGKMTFCANPVCNRLLIESDVVEGNIVSKPMCICHCGTSFCNSCGASHFGLNCGEFSHLMKEINSGRLCQEIKSGEWLRSNTKPCPRCSYPIQKNGGCNHMWCQQCKYYFCWVCGGGGQGCNAYSCEREQTVWAEKIEDDAMNVDLSNKATLFFRFQSLQSRLKDIDDAALRNEASDDFLMERQLCQVLLWLYALALYKSTNESQFAFDYLQDVRDRVEIVIHVLGLRDIAKSLDTSPILLIKNCDSESFKGKVDIISKKAEPTGSRKYSKRKKQMLEEQNKRNDTDTYRAMSLNHELFRLCNENETSFSDSASKVVSEAIQAIAQKIRQKRNSKKGKNKKTCKAEENGIAREENLSTVKISWRPWKEGYVVDKKNNSGINGMDVSNASGLSCAKKQPWKGKEAAKAKKERTREKFSLY